jgi:hypothetical protein
MLRLSCEFSGEESHLTLLSVNIEPTVHLPVEPGLESSLLCWGSTAFRMSLLQLENRSTLRGLHCVLLGRLAPLSRTVSC